MRDLTSKAKTAVASRLLGVSYWPLGDSADQDQTVRHVQSDLRFKMSEQDFLSQKNHSFESSRIQANTVSSKFSFELLVKDFTLNKLNK